MYYLLNKDDIIASFEVKGTGSLEYIEIIQKDSSKIPFWATDLENFIASRKATESRENMDVVFRVCNCGTISGYLDVSHSLSLNDTFWVKRSTETNLSWNKVSLYMNKFNSTIARMAIDGGKCEGDIHGISPEFTTGGTFAKCWIREEGNIKLLKKGSSGFANAGLESYSEYYCSQILRALQLNHVEYGLSLRGKKIAAKCNLFTSEEYGLIPYSVISKRGTVGTVVNFYKEHGLYEYISSMFIADSVMFNEDRHLGNFGFIVNNNTGKIEDTAPLYDHNISLMCYAMEDDFDYIDKYMADTNKGPRLGGNFVQVAKELMTPMMHKRLMNMYGFKLKKHPRYNLPDWRLDQLNKLINRQIELIIR